MPNPGAVSWEEALPSAVDGMSWNESDWHWDPVAMTATARQPTSADGTAIAASSAPNLPTHPGGCSIMSRLRVGILASLDKAEPEVTAKIADGKDVGAVLSSGSTPGSSSDSLPPAGIAGACVGNAATASRPSAARSRARAGGKQKKGAGMGGPCICQADGCGVDLSSHTYYHQRNKICAVHIKADVFLRDGQQLRFCQRCGHAHPLAEFDPGKHSCRKQLEKHNARRRKRQQEQAEAAAAGMAQGGGSCGSPVPIAAADTGTPGRAARRPRPAKRSRGQPDSSAAPAGGAAAELAGAELAPSADAMQAFVAAAPWDSTQLSVGTGTWPSAVSQEESGSAGEAAPPPVCASLQQQLEQAAAVRQQAVQQQVVPQHPTQQPPTAGTAGQLSLPLPAHSGRLGPSISTDTSAAASAAAITLPTAAAAPPLEPAPTTAPDAASTMPVPSLAAAAEAAAAATPPLPLLDFDCDLDALTPTPFEEIFPSFSHQPQQQQRQQRQPLLQQQQHQMFSPVQKPYHQQYHQQQYPQYHHSPFKGAAEAELADELAAWLDSNLAADEQAQRQAQQQQQQQAWQQYPTHGSAAATLGGLKQEASADAVWGVDVPLQEQPASLRFAQGIMQEQVLPALDGPLPSHAPTLLHSHQHTQQQQQYGSAIAHSTAAAPISRLATAQSAALPPPRAFPAALPAAASAARVAGGTKPPVAAGPAARIEQPDVPRASSPDGPAPTLATVSVKLFGCTPAELPTGLRDHLKSWFDGAVHSMDGYLRPGCVHLTVQALLGGYAAERMQPGWQGGEQAPADGRDRPAAAAGVAADTDVQRGTAAACANKGIGIAASGAAAVGIAMDGEADAFAGPSSVGAVKAEKPHGGCCHRTAAAVHGIAITSGNSTAAGANAGAAAAAVHAHVGAVASPAGSAGAGAPPPSRAPASRPNAAPDAEGPSAAAGGGVGGAGACCGRKRAAEGPAEAGGGGGGGAVRRVVDLMLRSGESLWRSKTMLVQAGSHVALVHQGRLRQTWDIQNASARAVPAILGVYPPVLLSSQPGELRVSGINMLQNDCRLLLRLQGRYVRPATAKCGDCSCSAPVLPGGNAGGTGAASPLGGAPAAAGGAAESFEERCCGCCVSKLQLAGLLPDTPASPAVATPRAASTPPPPPTAVLAAPAAAAPVSGCCQAAEPPCCAVPVATAQQKQEDPTPAQAEPAAAGPAGCDYCHEGGSVAAAAADTPPACPADGDVGGCPEAPPFPPPVPAPVGGHPGARRVCAGGARLQKVRLQLPSQPRQPHQQQQQQEEVGVEGEEALLPGLLHLDVQRHAYTAPQGARVLVVSSPAVHRELMQLVERSGPSALPPHVLDQLGVVHEWLGRPEKMQYQLVEATAARLLYWAVANGLPFTAELLLSVIQAQGGTSSTAAAAVLRRALQPEVVGSAAATALGELDGLSQLHLTCQATGAAAMQRAAELACHDGLSLLHRAVQSRCGATLHAVLGWGEDAGSAWRCDLAGPMGITPLHLAALLPDPSAASHTLLVLMSRCPPGAQAWQCCCTEDGQSPADFYRAAAAARGGGSNSGSSAAAAAAAFEAEVAALHQQQEQQQQPQRRIPPPALHTTKKTSTATAREPSALAAAGGALRTLTPPHRPGAAFANSAAAATRPFPHVPPPWQAQPTLDSPLGPLPPADGNKQQLSSPVAPPAWGDLQPSTPRKNPSCLCAPGCPCAQLDRCACCSSDSEEESGEEGSRYLPHGTCGAGSGRCCCCSKDASCHLDGCTGCAVKQGGAAGAAPTAGMGGSVGNGDGCCGGMQSAAAPAPAPSCCGSGSK